MTNRPSQRLDFCGVAASAAWQLRSPRIDHRRETPVKPHQQPRRAETRFHVRRAFFSHFATARMSASWTVTVIFLAAQGFREARHGIGSLEIPCRPSSRRGQGCH